MAFKHITLPLQTLEMPHCTLLSMLIILELDSYGFQELTMENHAPKELQPIKDFLAAAQTRIFIRIDYPRLCCQCVFRLQQYIKCYCTSAQCCSALVFLFQAS